MNTNNEYQQAKDIIDSLKLHQQVYIEVGSLPNFRKYLREIVTKRKTNEQFTTRDEQDKGLKIVRIR